MARPFHEAARRPPPERRHDPRRLSVAGLAALAVAAVLLATLVALPRSTAQPRPTATPPVPSEQAAGADAATATPTPAVATSPAAPRAAPSAPPSAGSAPLRTPSSTVPPTRSPEQTRHPDAAPASREDFDLEAQVIDILFPYKERARYRYRNNFGEARDGHAEGYNHARERRGEELLRAHDGIDVYAALGTPVVAPFDGVVIDPRTRWQPWIRQRYGKTAVIVSTEPLSEGYTALLSHLDALYVEPGQRVHRGEVVGTTGDSGNAEGGPPHLHFELRAPFALVWQQVGDERLVDAFNPFFSLRAADPNRHD